LFVSFVGVNEVFAMTIYVIITAFVVAKTIVIVVLKVRQAVTINYNKEFPLGSLGWCY
jgi:hypothetical protein